MGELAIAIIARDKFSRVKYSLESVVAQLPKNSKLFLFDSGYPSTLIDELKAIAGNVRFEVIETEQFANTNLVWNQIVSIANAKILARLENDTEMSPGCIAESLNILNEAGRGIAVPVVLENKDGLIGGLHFNPRRSEINSLPDGSIESILDRGRLGDEQMPTPRTIKHLERHCFFVTKSAVDMLGTLDERMYCRTDYDISIAAHVAGIPIIIPNTYVTFTQTPNMDLDRDFFDYRWNLDRVAFANARLIEKWNLKGFKTTITHAYEARKQLESSDI
jgi:hypothetical protein